MSAPAASASPSFYARNWKWFVLGTLFYSTFLNYLDRQTLGVALDPIAREFKLDIEQRGKLLATFVYVYAFSHLFIGFAIDRVKNLRAFFPAMLMAWSLVTVMMGLSRSYSDLLYMRGLLGVFECINTPICMLIIMRIFPSEQRAFASGIYISGAILATLVAPKLVIFLSTAMHWRWAFFVNGAIGMTWVLPWLLIFRRPEVRSESWARALAAQTAPESAADRTLGSVLSRPAFWAAVCVGVGLIPGSYFISQWLPSYFTQEWHLSYNQALGDRLVLVYLAQDVGLWTGGWVAMRLAARVGSVLAARRAVIFTAYGLAMAVMAMPFVHSLPVAIALICTYVFALGCWSANIGAFKQEVSAGRVATVAALVGFCELGFSAFLVDRVGSIVKATGGFRAVFPLLGAFLTFSVLVVLLMYRPRYFPLTSGRKPSAPPRG